jgi:hypothetical protein
MPIALDPNKRFSVVLKSDRVGPEDQRPTFHCRYLSGREWLAVAELNDALLNSKTSREALETMYRLVGSSLTGWSNLRQADGTEIAYDPTKLPDILNPAEIKEVLEAVMASIRPTADDKKK